MGTSEKVNAPRTPACYLCKAPGRCALFTCWRGVIYRCEARKTYFFDVNATALAGAESLFYSSIDEERYKEYFQPFRSVQYEHILSTAGRSSGKSLLDIGASRG